MGKSVFVRMIFAAALLPALAVVSGSAAAQAASRVGDRVRVWVSGDYYNGTVVEVGTGSHAGQYRIHFDNFSTEQYALARNVAPLRAAPAPRAASGKRGSNGCRIMVINGLPACDPATVKRH